MMPVGDTLADLHVINPMIRFQVWVIDVSATNSLIDCGFFNRIIPIHFSTQSLPDEDDIVRAACAWAHEASYDGESAQEGKLFEYVSIVDSVGVLLRDLDPTTMHSVPMLGGVKYVGDTTVGRSDPGSSLHCVVDSLLGRISEYRSLDKHWHVGSDLMSRSLKIEFFETRINGWTIQCPLTVDDIKAWATSAYVAGRVSVYFVAMDERIFDYHVGRPPVGSDPKARVNIGLRIMDGHCSLLPLEMSY